MGIIEPNQGEETPKENSTNNKDNPDNGTITTKTESTKPVPRYIHRNNLDKDKKDDSSKKKKMKLKQEIEIENPEDIYLYHSQIFFQKSHILNELTENDNIKQQVELFFSLTPNYKKTRQLICIQALHSKKSNTLFDVLGTTTSKQGKHVDFDTSFVIDYYFESQQYLQIKVLDGVNKKQIIGQFETTIANILGSKGQKLSINNNDIGVLTIKGNPYNKNDDLCVDLNINLFYPNQKIKPFFIVKRNVSQDTTFSWINSYKSEVNFEYPKVSTFQKSSLKIQMLSSECSLTKPFMIEFYDLETKTVIGNILTTVAEISDESFVGKLQNVDGQLIPNTKIKFSCEVMEEFKFLDYLRGGLQLSMIFGIDYTASNGEPTEKTSLHYISPDSYNNYQQAIRYCGDIVAFYDYDQLFPVFGYGANLNDSTETKFCFNVNFQEDPNVQTIDGVLEVYKQSLSKVKLYGPTYFSPIIKKAIEIAMNIVETKEYIYSILIILTDGKINDMQQTCDYLVRASYLPISIIIIGIGDADFTDMNTLDSDDVELKDSKGQKAVRDIVQFVPMNIFQSDGTLLAEKVLEEIPQQIIDYFKLIGEPPREANMFLI